MCVCHLLTYQPEAFVLDLGDDQSRYLYLKFTTISGSVYNENLYFHVVCLYFDIEGVETSLYAWEVRIYADFCC